jgi:aldehyde:ferredoxin oxidoreductase
LASLCPEKNTPKDCAISGHFGPYLKFSGWDALKIKGKAEKDVILIIDGNSGRVRIYDATFVKERDAHALADFLTNNIADNELEKSGVSVLCAGRGAEHSINGALSASYYDVKMKCVRLVQAARAGLGSVMRDKRILAVAVKYVGTNGALNNPVDLHEINRMAIEKHREIARALRENADFSTCGTALFISTAGEAEMLPVHNMQFGTHKNVKNIGADEIRKRFKQSKTSSCWYGCSVGCCRAIKDFRLRSGPYRNKKVLLDAPDYETLAYLGANCGIFNIDAILEIRYYCMTYGVEVITYATEMAFLMECYERGVINKEFTGGHELKFGNYQVMLDILHEMADGRGIGLIVGMGLEAIKEVLVEEYDEDRTFLDDIGINPNELALHTFLSKDVLQYQNTYDRNERYENELYRHARAFLKDTALSLEEKVLILQKVETLHEALYMFGCCVLPWQEVNPWQSDVGDSLQQIQVFCRLYKAMSGEDIPLKEVMHTAERIAHLRQLFKIRMNATESGFAPYRFIGPVTKREYVQKQELYDAELLNDAEVELDGLRGYDKIHALRKYRMEKLNKLIGYIYELRGWDDEGRPEEKTIALYELADDIQI